MEYHVTILPKEEFLRLWDLVLLAKDGIKLAQREPLAPLYRVSDRVEDFSEIDRPAISGPGYVGMYYHDGQIWLKPDEFYRDMQDTVLHELAHHEVPGEAHGPRWRKVFGIAFALHLRECGHPWDEIRHLVYTSVVAPNRIFRSITDPTEQRLIIRKEVKTIINHAKKKTRILAQRDRYELS